MNLADKWMCASWFKPDDYLLKTGGNADGRLMYFRNPAHDACGAWSNGLTYLLIAAALATVCIIVLTALYSREVEGKISESIVWVTMAGLAAGVLWPVSTFVLPIVAVASAGVKLGATLASRAAQRATRRTIELAEDAKRVKELAPYIAQLEKEMGK